MAKKTTNATKGDTILSQIVIRQPQRTTSDVAYWRNALRSADAGRLKALFDLYEDLLIDGVLYNAWNKRIEAVTNAELIFQDKDGETVSEIVDIMETLDWENQLKSFMKPIAYGRGGGEYDFSQGFRFTDIPVKHISLETQSILINDTDPSGISYIDDDNIIILGKLRDFGLFLKTAPYAIWKRGGFGDYAQWLELFAMPQRVGKYSSYDPQARALLEEALEKAGSAPWCVIPNESNVETVNNTGNGSSGTSYNDFRKACNEEMLITLVGQTLTTIQGDKGARSLGEVHKEVEEGINKADMRYVEKVLNSYVKPLLEKRGFPVKDGKFIFPAATENLEVTELISLTDILDIPASYVHEKYGIPVAKDGELIAKKRQPSETIKVDETVKGEKTETKKEEKSGQEEIKNDDRNFFLKLMDRFFVYAPTFRSGANQSFSAKSKRSITGRINLADNYSIDIDKLINKALREVYDNKGEELVNKNLFDITNNTLQHGIDTSLTIQDADEDFIRQFKENAAIFAAFKNHQQTKEIAALLYDADGKLVPFYKFKKEALKISDNYNINWLQTEYNTAVRAARMAANMKQYERTAHLYPNLEYIETNAAHPRDSHLMYVGTILPIGHEWWRTHLPPSDWNCDCSVRPTDKEATPVPPDYGGINPIFANNPAQTAEFINTKETPYYKHTDESLRDSVTAEGKRLQKEAEAEIIETYKGKKGGYLEIQRQQGNERDKNLTTYKILADRGEKYTLLRPSVVEGVKNPDAFNLTNGFYSDAKHPVTSFGKNAIQTSIKEASAQGVNEVIIRFEKEYSSRSVYEGLKAAFQRGRAKRIERVIIIPKGKEPVYFDVSALRKYFYKK